MNTEAVHPMVMKAARKANEIASRECNTCPEDGWKLYGAEYIRDAHEMLTECGALECLGALDWCVAEINRDSPSVLNARKVMSAINGSAPE